jgi:WD40 repeat protein
MPVAAAFGGIGLFDAAFLSPPSPGPTSTSGYMLVAGGPGGELFLWDRRASGSVAATLKTSQPGPTTMAVQLADSGHLIIAGTATGEVKFWDVRGGSGGALRFGGVVCPHPFLGSIRLDAALHSVPGLKAAAGHIPDALLRTLRLDPVDPRRLGFHLSCGWSGVLDLVTEAITHIHAPPREAEDRLEASTVLEAVFLSRDAPGVKRQACWTADGARFCVPATCGVQLLDFAPGGRAGCSVAALMDEEAAERDDDGMEGDDEVVAADYQREGREALGGSPSAVAVRLSLSGACVAAHPTREMVVVGGAMNRVSVVQH